jgi:hypothetical protein
VTEGIKRSRRRRLIRMTSREREREEGRGESGERRGERGEGRRERGEGRGEGRRGISKKRLEKSLLFF